MKKLLKFSSFINEHYDFEDFTMNDMEDVKELYLDGITEPEDLARETNISIDNVSQILATLRTRKDIE